LTDDFTFSAVAVVVCAIAAVVDWRSGLIPNKLTYPSLVLGLVGHAAYGLLRGGGRAAVEAFGIAFLGMLATSIVPLILYRVDRRAIGGGDIKLLASIGALMGAQRGVEAELYGFFIAMMYAPAKLAYEGTLWASLKNAGQLFANSFRRKRKQVAVNEQLLTEFRYAPALFLGALIAILV
jgi:prepilin peptidase CpaA